MTDEEDLSVVLTGLMKNARRANDAGKRKLANHPLTIELLEAGVRLIERELDRGDPLLARWLSYDQVTTEVNRRGNWPKPITAGARRDRWPDSADYIRDVVAYAIRAGYAGHYLAGTGHERENLLGNADLSRAIHDASYADLTMAVTMTATRIQLISAAVAGDKGEGTGAALADMYKAIGDTWTPIYAGVLRSLGAELRPGFTIDDLTCILTAVSEGLQLRMLGDPNCPVIDHGQRTTLLGKAALAMFLSCVDHFGDGKSLEELVNGD